MTMNTTYAAVEPTRAEIDALPGTTLVEFGAPWCGFCMAAQPLLAEALQHWPELRHVKIEDGSGRRLGRSFGIKLWPTLVLMKNGVEVARVIRPGSRGAIADVLAAGADQPAG